MILSMLASKYTFADEIEVEKENLYSSLKIRWLRAKDWLGPIKPESNSMKTKRWKVSLMTGWN